MRVFLNPHCDYGGGRKKWENIEPSFRLRYGDFEVEEIYTPDHLPQQIKKAAAEGERIFIAAGGDGTVNLVVNALCRLSATREIIFGAIGLGSSNDFHKPFRPETFIHGIPTRMNKHDLLLNDVIRIQYRNSSDHISTRYSIINSSLGITAEANAFYNLRLPFVYFIRKISSEAAIILSALKTIFTYHNIPCALSIKDSFSQRVLLTNLGIIKNPHFAGNLCYDTPVEADDGKLVINLCLGMTKWEAVRILLNLQKHKFCGLPKTYSWNATQVKVKSPRPFALEMDGEVVHASWAEFKLIPKALRCFR